MRKALRNSLIFATLCTSMPAVGQSVLISAPTGDMRGALEKGQTVAAFRGVPFAIPPVGDWRWKAARPIRRWSGLRDATRAAPRCMQPANTERTAYIAEPDGPSSEDCLYLNVWIPVAALKRKQTARLPVLLWIHGGGENRGWASSPRLEGASLASRGVILVAPSYRLGVLGFMTHPELNREAASGTSGNYGLTDQIEALRWVRENIAHFGGDPGNVTIAGESAGGASVLELMASPLARGLFHRAIVQSGGLFALPTLAGLGGKGADAEPTNSVPLAQLRALTATQAMRITMGRFGDVSCCALANVDGLVLTKQPRETFARGEQAQVPLLVGYNADEGSVFKSVPDRVTPIIRDQSVLLAGSMRSPAYVYLFSHVTAGADRPTIVLPNGATIAPRAFHSAEIPFVFDTVDAQSTAYTLIPLDAPSPTDRALARTMADLWTEFARDGVPSAPGVPKWPRYEPAAPRLMIFDAGATVRPLTAASVGERQPVPK